MQNIAYCIAVLCVGKMTTRLKRTVPLLNKMRLVTLVLILYGISNIPLSFMSGQGTFRALICLTDLYADHYKNTTHPALPTIIDTETTPISHRILKSLVHRLSKNMMKALSTAKTTSQSVNCNSSYVALLRVQGIFWLAA